jgi:transposase
MQEFNLPAEEIQELRAAHREAKKRSAADAYRINAVILLATGWAAEEVAEILLLDDETIKLYVKRYKQGGVPLLLERHYLGGFQKISTEQSDVLRQELDRNIYLTTKSICVYVTNKFNVDYTISGMTALLRRLGYVYKKPKVVPGKADMDAQEIFIQQYENFMATKPEHDPVLFVDGVHPTHNTMAAYGWIKKGEVREIKSNTGRERLNINGAIDIESLGVTVVSGEAVNSETTIDLFNAIEAQYPLALTIYIILDNARYYHSKQMKEYLASSSSRIKLIPLPSYSPNLNLIERLWHFFKKKVLYNQYYEKFKDFEKAVMKFFTNIGNYRDELSTIMSAEFQLIGT